MNKPTEAEMTRAVTRRLRPVKPKAAPLFSTEEEKLLLLLGGQDGRMVYADWLEERSQTKKAAIVRLQDRIITRAEESERVHHAKKGMWGETSKSRKKWSKLTTIEQTIIEDGVELMREYLDLEKTDPQQASEWAAHLSAPYPLIGSYWYGIESDKTRKGFHFRKTRKKWETTQEKKEPKPKAKPKAKAKTANLDTRPSGWAISEGLVSRLLSYRSHTSGYSNGVWRQVGPVMTFNTNRGYAYYVGVLFSGNRIYGMSHNCNDYKWAWRVVRISREQYKADDADDE